MFDNLEPYSTAVIASSVTAGLSLGLGYLLGRREYKSLQIESKRRQRRIEAISAENLQKSLEISQLNDTIWSNKQSGLRAIVDIIKHFGIKPDDIKEWSLFCKQSTDDEVEKAMDQCLDRAECQKQPSHFVYRKTSWRGSEKNSRTQSE